MDEPRVLAYTLSTLELPSLAKTMPAILLPANQPPDRPYVGGRLIAKFRSKQPSSSHEGEDWIASTTCCNGCTGSKLGMTRLPGPDGRLFADVVAESPEYWLGPEHVKAFGADIKILVKLVDAGQRLFVHAHPDGAWARKHLVGTARSGKTEAWYILTPGEVHLGLKEDVPHSELLDLVESGRGSELLMKMHRLEVKPFQCVFVPAGTLHSIGEGVMVVEVQEPEDLSILCEWAGFEIDGLKDGHLGLGFDTALTAVNAKGCTRSEIEQLIISDKSSGSVLVDQAKAFFQMERIQVDGGLHQVCRGGFAVVIVCDGDVEYSDSAGTSMSLAKGSTLVIPHGGGDFGIHGKGEVVITRPPLP